MKKKKSKKINSFKNFFFRKYILLLAVIFVWAVVFACIVDDLKNNLTETGNKKNVGKTNSTEKTVLTKKPRPLSREEIEYLLKASDDPEFSEIVVSQAKPLNEEEINEIIGQTMEIGDPIVVAGFNIEDEPKPLTQEEIDKILQKTM